MGEAGAIHLDDHEFKEFPNGKQLRIWKKTKQELSSGSDVSKKYSELAKLEIEQDDLLCIICNEKLRNIVYLKCKHCCTCDECVTMQKEEACPVCRTPSEHIKIFWA